MGNRSIIRSPCLLDTGDESDSENVSVHVTCAGASESITKREGYEPFHKYQGLSNTRNSKINMQKHPKIRFCIQGEGREGNKVRMLVSLQMSVDCVV